MKVYPNPCRFCGEKIQFEYVEVDRKTPDRDLIKCRKCESRARRKYWDMKEEGQKKSHSFLESIVNVLIGFAVSFAANIIVLPWFGFHVTARDAFGIGLIFTVISIVRSYVIRRVFNKIMVRDKQ